MRKQQGGTVINYVYSFSGQLLVEDNLTTESSESYVYFNGRMVAIQGDNESSFKLLMKDRMGSTRKTYTVTVPGYGKTLNETYKYDPWGQIIYSSQSTPPYTDIKYQEKERENDLDYFGTRYYDALSVANGSSMRWISTDPVTSSIFYPQSLNQYSYVRNDPVNLVDPDGRAGVRICGGIVGGESNCENVNWDPPAIPVIYPRGGVIGGGAIGAGGSGPRLQPFMDVALARVNEVPPRGNGKSNAAVILGNQLNARIGSMESPCSKFLEGVIKALGSQLANGFTVNMLVYNIISANRIENASGFEKGVYEDVSDNTIRISPQGMTEHTYNWGRGVFPYYGDKLTVYLHAGFHLASSAGSKERISDSALYAAAAPLVRLSVDVIPERLKSSIVGAAFAMACGPGTAVPAPSKRGY